MPQDHATSQNYMKEWKTNFKIHDSMTGPTSVISDNSTRNKKNLIKKNDRRRLNGIVFCNMSLGEELTKTFTTMTEVSCSDNHLSQD